MGLLGGFDAVHGAHGFLVGVNELVLCLQLLEPVFAVAELLADVLAGLLDELAVVAGQLQRGLSEVLVELCDVSVGELCAEPARVIHLHGAPDRKLRFAVAPA